MEEPGHNLREARARLRLRYRDVQEASQRIADRRGNREFFIGLSRLADIENKGTIPSLYRIYSLCAIYGLEFSTVLGWYGIELHQLPGDAARLGHKVTRIVDIRCPDRAEVEFPAKLDGAFDLRKTLYLATHIQRWGKLPILLLNGLDLKRQHYGFVGVDDWSMYPILPPGSFVQIDETKRRVTNESWVHEYERPIYFVNYRDGYRCGWCTQRGRLLIVQPHSTSHLAPEIFRYPEQAEVIGQVVGVAMRLDLGKRRHTHS